MKKIYILMLVWAMAAGTAKTQNVEQKTDIKSDTIYMNITDFKADSMIKAHKGDTSFYILDVRTEYEFNTGHIANANNIDYYAPDFSTQLNKLDRSKTYLLHCKGGSRSGQVFSMMQSMKFKVVYNMIGGFDQWRADGLPVDMTITTIADIATNTVGIYPNPATTVLNIATDQTTATVRIYTTSGQLLTVTNISQTANTIDVNTLPVGLYMIDVISNKNITHLRFIKN